MCHKALIITGDRYMAKLFMKWPYGDLHLFISLKKAIKLDLSRKMHSKNGSVSLSVPETSLLWE